MNRQRMAALLCTNNAARRRDSGADDRGGDGRSVLRRVMPCCNVL